ncbi:GGDEF domain-containing protein [Companilactobacillus mindensis]|nr:GGDEF domain-containing protein [Companilactobacillus mindensis]GEO79771.1 GGDEF domain-containing protein [Companilactobacillus mindensis]
MLTNTLLSETTLISSLFFIMGVFLVFQVIFDGIKKFINLKKYNIDEYLLRFILGIIYILIIMLTMQLSIRGKHSAWIYVNFQLVATIFYTVILSVPTKHDLFAPIVLIFMLFNSAIFSWQSWCMALILIGFYHSLNYTKSHTKNRFPFVEYLLSSAVFGFLYWFFLALKFNLTPNIYFREVFYLIVLEAFTFGYIYTLYNDIESRTALFKEAIHDKLTETYNYDAFDIDLRADFKKYQRDQTTFSMMMFDVDHFKHINDTYDHLAGDKVLQNIVNVVKKVIAANDPKIKLYRTGGEEFNVIFPEYDLDSTKRIVNEIFSVVNHSQTLFEDNTIHLTISVGVSEISPNDNSTNDFYSRVDKALYSSKKSGRKAITIS